MERQDKRTEILIQNPEGISSSLSTQDPIRGYDLMNFERSRRPSWKESRQPS